MAAPMGGSARTSNPPIVARENPRMWVPYWRKDAEHVAQGTSLMGFLDENIQREMLAHSTDMGLLGRLGISCPITQRLTRTKF